MVIPARISGETILVALNVCVSLTDNCRPMRVTQNDLRSHIDKFIHEKQTALEHLLMNQDATFRLCRHNEEYAQQVGSQSRPRTSAKVIIEPSMKVSIS